METKLKQNIHPLSATTCPEKVKSLERDFEKFSPFFNIFYIFL